MKILCRFLWLNSGVLTLSRPRDTSVSNGGLWGCGTPCREINVLCIDVLCQFQGLNHFSSGDIGV